MASVEIITTSEALQQWFLPWQVVLGERQHLSWQHPKWWRACLNVNVPNLPYWAVVSSGNSVVGMVPVRRSNSRFRSIWVLNLCPLSGGGVVGGQATAVLNAVIGKLSADPNRSQWDLFYDPNDIYLKNRFELAFQTAKLTPSKSRPAIIGWQIEAASVDDVDRQSNSNIANDQELVQPDGSIVWWQSGISDSTDKSNLPGPPDLSEFQQSQTRWLKLDNGIFIGIWNATTSRQLGGHETFFARRTWMPCCLVMPKHGVRQQAAAASQVVDALFASLGDQVQRWQIPASLDLWLTTTGMAVDWPMECQKRGSVAKRWLMQERSFHRPNMWQRFSEAISS